MHRTLDNNNNKIGWNERTERASNEMQRGARQRKSGHQPSEIAAEIRHIQMIKKKKPLRLTVFKGNRIRPTAAVITATTSHGHRTQNHFTHLFVKIVLASKAYYATNKYCGHSSEKQTRANTK